MTRLLHYDVTGARGYSHQKRAYRYRGDIIGFQPRRAKFLLVNPYLESEFLQVPQRMAARERMGRRIRINNPGRSSVDSRGPGEPVIESLQELLLADERLGCVLSFRLLAFGFGLGSFVSPFLNGFIEARLFFAGLIRNELRSDLAGALVLRPKVWL